MDNRKIIQQSINYIEENLKSEITAKELSGNVNFSLFHFYRLFQYATGMPVMQYIIRRKLLYAIYEIGCGNKIIDVALEYGFNTHSGFYKAFKREFGFTPSQFLKKYKATKPYKINLFKEEHIMITHKKITLLLKNWDLQDQKITDVFYESGARNDHAYYIGNDYVLKFSANLGSLKTHMDISKSIEKVGLYAATPIKTVNNDEIVIDGQLYFILTKRLQGQRIKATDMYDGDFINKSKFVGEIVGQLSIALNSIDDVVCDANILDNVINWALPKTKEIIDIPKNLCEDYVDKFAKLYNNLPKQIIHRDPNPSNIIVCGDNWGFIDFELSEKNVRIFDPCYAATAILSESYDENDNEKLLKWIEIYKNIIYGYDLVANLSQDEKDAIPYIILSNQLIGCAWLSEQEKYKSIFEVNKKMTKWLCDNFDKLQIK